MGEASEKGFGGINPKWVFVFVPQKSGSEGKATQPRAMAEWVMDLFPCPGNPGLVLEASGVGSHPCHKCFGSQPPPLLRGRVLGEGTCSLGDKGQDLRMEEVWVL